VIALLSRDPLTQDADRNVNGNIYKRSVSVFRGGKRHFCKKMASWPITKNGMSCTTVRFNDRRAYVPACVLRLERLMCVTIINIYRNIIILL